MATSQAALRVATKYLAVLLGMPLAEGCSSPASVPPPPPLAHPLTGNGAYETRLDLVVQDLRRRLAEHGARQLQVQTYEVPNTTTFEEVAAYYRKAGGTSWKPADDIPASGFAYRFGVWRSAGRVLAVALIERPEPGSDTPFRILVEAHSL